MAEPLDISMIEAPPQLDPDPTASFSTTESIPSETYRAMADKPEPVRPQSGSHKPEESSTSTTEMPTAYLPTVTAYDAWAPIYDTDGNVLQKVDDLELERMLPEFVSEALGSQKTDGAMRILDLGCGTGRNTLKLVTYLWPEDMRVEITGIDASRGMLEIAKTKLHAVIESLNRRKSKSIHLSLSALFCLTYPSQISQLSPLSNTTFSTLQTLQIPRLCPQHPQSRALTRS